MFPWIQARELLGDGTIVYTNTDPHGSARKIAADLLSHWSHIFIVSDKGKPAYPRLIILQQRVNCKEISSIHLSSLNKKCGHQESWNACLGVNVCRYVESSSGR